MRSATRPMPEMESGSRFVVAGLPEMFARAFELAGGLGFEGAEALLNLAQRLVCRYELFRDHYDGAGQAGWKALHSWSADDGGRSAGVSGVWHDAWGILEDFPHLTEEDIRACLAFAADRERKVEMVMA